MMIFFSIKRPQFLYLKYVIDKIISMKKYH